MSENKGTLLPQLLANRESEILKEWTAEQARSRGSSLSGMKDDDLRRQSSEFLGAFRRATQAGDLEDISSESWVRLKEILTDLSRDQARQGASPADIALFIFSLKQILFRILQSETGNKPEIFAREIWSTTQMLDRLGLFTIQVAMKSRGRGDRPAAGGDAGTFHTRRQAVGRHSGAAADRDSGQRADADR